MIIGPLLFILFYFIVLFGRNIWGAINPLLSFTVPTPGFKKQFHVTFSNLTNDEALEKRNLKNQFMNSNVAF